MKLADSRQGPHTHTRGEERSRGNGLWIFRMATGHSPCRPLRIDCGGEAVMVAANAIVTDHHACPNRSASCEEDSSTNRCGTVLVTHLYLLAS